VSGTYLTWLADALRAGGCYVVEYDGWQTRARSSGGFASGRPLAVFWHHTASQTSPQNDANYMCHGSDNRPVANVLIARDGAVWLLAAGATNTNGKGRSLSFSRGTVPADSANSYVFGMEIANSGVGETYPRAQVDAAFKVSNIVNQRMGNRPNDVCTHQHYAPDRKIDPAMGGYAVEGSWHPGECTSSGSWNVDDLRSECQRRGGGAPPPSGEDEYMISVWGYSGNDTDGAIYAVSSAGFKYWLTDQPMVDATLAYCAINGWSTDISGTDDRALFRAFGPVMGPSAGDAWGLPG
jgi:hypothetical protein